MGTCLIPHRPITLQWRLCMRLELQHIDLPNTAFCTNIIYAAAIKYIMIFQRTVVSTLIPSCFSHWCTASLTQGASIGIPSSVLLTHITAVQLQSSFRRFYLDLSGFSLVEFWMHHALSYHFFINTTPDAEINSLLPELLVNLSFCMHFGLYLEQHLRYFFLYRQRYRV